MNSDVENLDQTGTKSEAVVEPAPATAPATTPEHAVAPETTPEYAAAIWPESESAAAAELEPAVEPTTEPTPSPAPRKRGLIIALIALVAVIIVGYVAYTALARSNAPESNHTPTASSTTSSQGSQMSHANMPKLADYDASVIADDGSQTTLTQIAGNRMLVMNFWATWCPYCIQEMPDFQEIYRDYGDRVSFAFIDCVDGRRETVEDGRTWLAKNNLSLPVYYDTTQDAVSKYGASALPTTVVVDAKGYVQVYAAGRIDPDKMRSLLDELLVA